MSKFCKTEARLCVIFLFLAVLADAVPRPQPEQSVAARDAEDLSTGATENEKEDLQGSASIGYGYYSYPYVGGYYGSYYPYYSGYYGLGYPYYGGYYGGYHGGFHGHYF